MYKSIILFDLNFENRKAYTARKVCIMQKSNIAIPPISLLIRDRKFHSVNPEINDTTFPIPSCFKDKYKLFNFGEISSENAAKRMGHEKCRPANCHELLSWEKWGDEDNVVALGAFITKGNHLYVPCLNLYKSQRRLILELRDPFPWNYNHFLLGVYL